METHGARPRPTRQLSTCWSSPCLGRAPTQCVGGAPLTQSTSGLATPASSLAASARRARPTSASAQIGRRIPSRAYGLVRPQSAQLGHYRKTEPRLVPPDAPQTLIDPHGWLRWVAPLGAEVPARATMRAKIRALQVRNDEIRDALADAPHQKVGALYASVHSLQAEADAACGEARQREAAVAALAMGGAAELSPEAAAALLVSRSQIARMQAQPTAPVGLRVSSLCERLEATEAELDTALEYGKTLRLLAERAASATGGEVAELTGGGGSAVHLGSDVPSSDEGDPVSSAHAQFSDPSSPLSLAREEARRQRIRNLSPMERRRVGTLSDDADYLPAQYEAPVGGRPARDVRGAKQKRAARKGKQRASRLSAEFDCRSGFQIGASSSRGLKAESRGSGGRMRRRSHEFQTTTALIYGHGAPPPVIRDHDLQ